MRGVTKAALDQRLDAAGEDREFKELITAYNVMLERLQQSFQQASRFSADAAHELKTPLTILRGRVEQAIKKSDNRAIQADLTQLLDEVGRLAAITRKLLLLSRPLLSPAPLLCPAKLLPLRARRLQQWPRLSWFRQFRRRRASGGRSSRWTSSSAASARA